MGFCLNPGSTQFRKALNSQIYVDKTALIGELNKLANTMQQHLCVSRPRRFGKSLTLSMLCAYYGIGEDNRELFANRALGKLPDWDSHLGKYDVILLTMTDFLQSGRSLEASLEMLTKRVLHDLKDQYPEAVFFEPDNLSMCLLDTYAFSRRQFIFLVDEWDVLFRTHPDDSETHTKYLNWLRDILKDKAYVAMSYLTGILPVKKYGTQSALNMFDEYSFIKPHQLAPYTGFTDEEVRALCDEFGRDYREIEAWYDGYRVYGPTPPDPGRLGLKATEYKLYSPLSVVNAVRTGDIQNYWNKTENYKALAQYIQMDFDGLRERVARLMQGERLPVCISNFQNDLASLEKGDDVLTLLIHMGYLGFQYYTHDVEPGAPQGEVFIPNRELLEEFHTATNFPDWSSTFRAIRNSRELLRATLAGDAETVAQLVEAAHDTAGNRTYNSEAALSYAIQLAYYAAQDDYTLVPEMDTGRGYADLVYLPKKPGLPALLVELKVNESADTAIAQIQRQKYPARLEGYKGNLVCVGIAYDRSADFKRPDFKQHSCHLLRG